VIGEVVITPERPDMPDARRLIDELDEHLGARYPPSSRHAFSVDRLLEEGVEFFVLRAGDEPAACGGILFVEASEEDDRPYGEVKRMFEEARLRGVDVLRLETGIYQTEAIGLYERTGFRPIGPFGPYVDDPLCAYFEKHLGEDGDRPVRAGER
jgi:hypothetical protein